MEKSTKYLTYLATFTALSVFTNWLAQTLGTPTNQVTFTYVPCFFAGIFLGPVAGFVTGAVGDVIALLLFPIGAWLPLMTLASGLLGFIPGVVFKYIKIKKSTLKLVISFLACLIICTACLNMLSIYFVFMQGKKTFWAFFIARFPFSFIMAVVNFIIIDAMLKVKPLVKILSIKK